MPKNEISPTLRLRSGISRRMVIGAGARVGLAASLRRRCCARSRRTPRAASSRSAMSVRKPVRSPASARPTPSSSTRCGQFCRSGIAERRAHLSGGRSSPRTANRAEAEPLRSPPSSSCATRSICIVASATPDTTNPVADQAEVNEVPCITTNCPWQPYFFGRKGDPAKGFTWTYHFFWGLEDVIGAFLALWDIGADQQGRRRPVSQRCRRQCLGRSAARPAAGARAGRLQAVPIPAAIS